jgi:hypothetical protein
MWFLVSARPGQTGASASERPSSSPSSGWRFGSAGLQINVPTWRAMAGVACVTEFGDVWVPAPADFLHVSFDGAKVVTAFEGISKR